VTRIGLAVVACAAVASACGASPGDAERPPRVLRVSVAGDGPGLEVATGVAVGGGRVLTVAHALSGGRRVTVAGRPARIVRVDRRLDLALLAVPAIHAPRVRLGGSPARVRLAVLRDRHADSLPASVRRRVVVHWRDQPTDPPRDRPGLELAARIDPGDSGAPVLDRRGRLVGVLYARSSGEDGTAWAVDASAVRSVLGG
jgi:S1-C subfamily serine protease